ncbi:MAG: hypothetical protein JWP12_2112 [Bacteroidetes bacterium]|nr:hypothetical protein [Bacteroidota bacterium]
MTSNIPENSKLDEAVKNTLNNYEAPFDSADWSRMERILDTAPKSSNFNWSYAIGAVLGLAIIGGGYFAYTNYTSKHNDAVSITPPPAPKTEQVITPSPKTTTTTAAPVTTTPAVTQPSITATPPPAITDNQANKPADAATTKTPVAKDDKSKAKKQKTTDISADPDANVIVHQHVAGMGNEPVFGDMLDSSRGIIGETKEKDETKKAAKAKKDVPVGWNAFMLPNVNTDSLRKYKDRRDSLKVN